MRRRRERKRTAMIYYRPQILFLLGARQLRLRSSIFFPFTAHRATFPHLSPLPPLFRAISQSDWLPPLLSACQHFYTFIHRSLVSIVPGANSFGHNTSRRATIILLVLPKYRQRILSRPRVTFEKLLRFNAPASNGSCKLYTRSLSTPEWRWFLPSFLLSKEGQLSFRFLPESCVHI